MQCERDTIFLNCLAWNILILLETCKYWVTFKTALDWFSNSGFQICTSYWHDDITYESDIYIIALKWIIRPTYVVERETYETIDWCNYNILELPSEGSWFETPPSGLNAEFVLIVSLFPRSEFQDSTATIALKFMSLTNRRNLAATFSTVKSVPNTVTTKCKSQAG
jgi:hypothetical protein